MIEVAVESEFGTCRQKYNHGFTVRFSHPDLSFYKDVDEEQEWLNCPCCNMKPRVWTFDNGRSTACGCWETTYDIFSVKAESIMSVHIRTDGKKMNEYKCDDLRKNWNEYCMTMISPCNHADLREEGNW